jgi:hypothetical protein
MKNIKDVLLRDPAANPLVNQGQARIADKTNEKVLKELKGELSTFVCEGQFADGMERIVSSFLGDLNRTSQKGAWVSGFFGSGKSHLLKMLCHLWQDTVFPDGSTARSLVPSVPDELRNLLRELDTAAKREGGLLAAAGSLPSGTTDNVRLTVLGVLLRGVGLPDQYPQAQFCLWLQDQGYFDSVKSTIETAGKEWTAELNNLYVSKLIANAVLACDPKFAPNETEARKTIRETFPTRNTDVTTAEFLEMFKRALKLNGRDGKLPCTALVLDEVQLYIGDSNDRSVLITEVAEAVSKQLDSHVIIIGAGQSALTDMRLLNRMMDRFTIRVPLSDTDVETVTRKVLLQKKPSEISEVRKRLVTYGGEISRQLQGTRIGESVEDREILIDDYPLLPVRRRFWEQCFRQIDAAGTQSQLRSQLRIIHDAVAKISDRPLGVVVPGDELYEELAPEMVNTGVLLRELNERIINLAKDGSQESKLERRICGLVFLIGRLPRDAGADIGVRANKEHIADLLIDDLAADNGKFRDFVATSLEKLAADGVLMKLGDEYRLQTKEGSEWDREFKNRRAKLANDDADVQMRRDALLYAEADRIIRSQRITQGIAKESRQLSVSRAEVPPDVTGDNIPVWVRDGWSASEKELVDAARAAGSDSPILYVFIPRQSAEDLRRLVIDADAAQQTLDAKGTPTGAEGLEARQSLISRRDLAAQQRDELVRQVVANAKAFQGGGSELLQLTLAEKIDEGAKASLVRLFPRFKEADATGSAWESVIRRARDGADQPFQPVGYTGTTEQHPISQQVLSTIGAGKTGADIRKTLGGSPFGWPRDAVDAALIALHRSQSITATLNGVPVALGQLDQNKISKSEFRVERATLTVSDRLAIRKLFSGLISCKTGEESAKAPEFLNALIELANQTTGPPPLPSAPTTTEIHDLKKLVGNEQLVAIRRKAGEIEKLIEDWKKAKDLADQRKPAWEMVQRFAKHASGISGATEYLKELESIRSERLLLNLTDPVAPIKSALSDVVRQAATDACANNEKAYAAALSKLRENSTWSKVPESEQERIKAEVGLTAPQKVDISSDEALLARLDSHPLTTLQAEADAIAGRTQRALEIAAKYLEPKVQLISIERTTLCSVEDVREWLSRQEKLLLKAVETGPVLVS